jgi:putative membrane protein
MLKEEWKSLWNNKLMFIIIVSIAMIPALYNVLFLSSMWDPYGKVSNLPVAVINLDEPVEYEGNTLSIGNDIVENLKENDALDFIFVNADEVQKADEGLKDGTYYMVITIPKDFSLNATTLMDSEPKKMILDYATNPGSNYIASKMSESALSKIQTSVQKSVTETYAESLFGQIEEIGDKMQEAADGAQELVDGSNELVTGTSKISDGTKDLYDGATALNDGATKLAEGVNTATTGASNLETGITSLASGAVSLSDGSKNALEGSSHILAGFEGEKGLVAGSKALANGAANLNDAISKIDFSLTEEQKGAIQTAASESTSATKAANQLTTGIASGVATNIKNTLTNGNTISTVTSNVLSNPEINQLIVALETYCGYSKEQAKAVVNQIVSGSLNGVASYITADSIDNSITDSVTGAVQQVAAGAAVSGAEAVTSAMNLQLTDETTDLGLLKSSVTALSTGALAMSSGIDQLYQGNQSLNSGLEALNSGAVDLSSGALKVSKGMNSLYTGMNQLSGGAIELEVGTSTLTTGAKALLDGDNSLTEGIRIFAVGSKELQSGLQEGADKITDIKADDNTYNMIANPVESQETQVTQVPNNGSAMAAYMLCAGLWVGCIAFTLMYPLMKYPGELKNGFRWWASKASVLGVVAIIQALLMVFLLRLFCGFDPVQMGITILLSCIVSCTFMSILYFSNAMLGKIGSYIMVIFMLLQLSGSTGTYPIELSADYVAKIHRFLPFSYGVEAFRSTISGGKSIVHDVTVLITIFLVFTGLTIVLFTLRTRNIRRNRLTMYDRLVEKGMS